ncbi:hypothetical protein GGR56DRAFT_641677 [Xylariaceae sp. FL0804]|nr:hypothetical protein GGR56DRAFT_641677 [Xylariaceae sp. FL0804]
MQDQNHANMDVMFASTIWPSLAVQQDSRNHMLRLPVATYALLGQDGRNYLVQTAREALGAIDVEFFADDENGDRVTLASRSHIRALGYETLWLNTSNLPTLTLSFGPPSVPIPGLQPSIAGPSASQSGE